MTFGSRTKELDFKKQHDTRLTELFSKREIIEEKDGGLSTSQVENVSFSLTPGSPRQISVYAVPS